MGNFQKHFELAKEKYEATITAYRNKQSSTNTQMKIFPLKLIKQCVRYGLPMGIWVMMGLMAKEQRQ